MRSARLDKGLGIFDNVDVSKTFRQINLAHSASFATLSAPFWSTSSPA
jgi:hypothetical protein